MEYQGFTERSTGGLMHNHPYDIHMAGMFIFIVLYLVVEIIF